MYRNISAFTLFIFMTAALFSQEKTVINQYMRLNGQFQNESWFVLHLIRAGDSLYGELIPEIALSKLHLPATAGRPFMMGGKIDQKGSFSMELWPTDRRFSISGRFIPKTASKGTAATLKLGVRSYQVTMVENYPEGSIKMEVYTVNARQMLIKGQDSPAALVKLTFLQPDGSLTTGAGDTLRNNLAHEFAPELPAVKPKDLLETCKREFFEEYTSGNATLYKEMPGASFEWELSKFMHIVFNQNGQLSTYTLSYDFTGGAHGMESRTYALFDTRTGKRIELSGLFKPGYKKELSSLLTRKLKQDRKIHPSVKLSDSGFFVDEIEPIDNMYITGSGIGFYYNPYEIAPYSFGGTEIFLPYADLRNVLKKP